MLQRNRDHNIVIQMSQCRRIAATIAAHDAPMSEYSHTLQTLALIVDHWRKLISDEELAIGLKATPLSGNSAVHLARLLANLKA